MRNGKRVTLREVAGELGVSQVTVHNALAGRGGVSGEVNRAVREKAKELGMDLSRYENRHLDENATVGILVSRRYISVGSSFYWTLYERTAYAASRSRYLTMLEIVEQESSGDMPKILTSGSIDGLIIIGRLPEEMLNRIVSTAGIPVVLLDFLDVEGRCDAVLSANYIGMYRMTGYLLSRGARKIDFLGTPETSGNVGERLAGYLRSMLEHGMEVTDGMIVRDRDPETEAESLTLPDPLPDAFVCSSDYAADHLIQALYGKGIRVPEDIWIASYDDFLANRPDSNELTTYHVDMNRMASEAVRLLMRRMQQPGAERVIVSVDGRIVVRTSAGEAAQDKGR